jgi:Protein of unknown function (DUF4058)
MPSPFSGMDPWLERPNLWPDVHNSLIAAIRDVLAPRLRPRYIVTLEERVFVEEQQGLSLVGRPDLAVVGASSATGGGSARSASAVVEVELPVTDRARETYLEVRGVPEGDVVTVIEVLSPSNKRKGEGRRVYLEKRTATFASLTSLVEIDLLRAGESMPVVRGRPASDYSILVSRSWARPRADLLPFSVREEIPRLPVPLRRSEEEPMLELGTILHELYDRAGYDLRIDYAGPPDPPLGEGDAVWAHDRLKGARPS